VFTERYKLFLRRLRAARQAAGLTQMETAERLNPTSGLTPPAAKQQLLQTQRFVSRCETGERRVDVTELWLFCRALNIPFVDFVQELAKELEQSEH